MPKKATKPAQPGAYRHDTAGRLNQPTVEMLSVMSDEDTAPQPFEIDGLDDLVDVGEATISMGDEPRPRLAWQREGATSSDDNPRRFAGSPLYTREKVHPLRIAAQLSKTKVPQPNLFKDFNGLPEEAHWEFYQHRGNWQNRLIHGDSSPVMQSLIARDGLAGQVQMVYFDPPYGISYKSNFASSASRNDATNIPTGDSFPLRVFRDSYRNGIHSYLDGIHERLTLFRELLTDSGSLFLQIGNDNVHLLALVCDEVFGSDNRVATITWQGTSMLSASHLAEVGTYVLWYAKDKPALKYRQLYRPFDNKNLADWLASAGGFAYIEEANGGWRRPTKEERETGILAAEGSRAFKVMDLTAPGASPERTCRYLFEGVEYYCGSARQWRVSTPQRRTNEETRARDNGASEAPNGMDRLAELGRLHGTGGSLGWKQYADEHPGIKLNNVWAAHRKAQNKRYAVQTSPRIVERCLLMATDPGDLILDPTCGSGVTAETAERWGRRWITIDAGRVSVAVTRRHLLTCVHPWYETEDGGSDPAANFKVETMPRVSAATLAYDTVNDKKNLIRLVDRPRVNKSRVRLTGPFTVEAHNPYVHLPFREDEDGGEGGGLGAAEAVDAERILDALRGHPVRDCSGRAVFEVLELEAYPHPGSMVTYEAECRIPDRETRLQAGVMIAAPDVTVTGRMAAAAATQAVKLNARVEHLIVVAAAYEDNVPPSTGLVRIHRIETSRDLLISELKDEPDTVEFTLLGEPDLNPRRHDDGTLSVELLGYDTYNPASNTPESSDNCDEVDCWMIDTNHDGTAFIPHLLYLPGYKRGDPHVKRLLKGLGKRLDPEAADRLHGLVSQPFPPPEGKNVVAVKIVTDTGAEMTATVGVGEFE